MPAPVRVAYGDQPQQFADLHLPDGHDHEHDDHDHDLPVVVLIHGGFWRANYGLDLMDPLAEDLSRTGYAVWNIEYRRVGQPGGGWPGTLHDVAAAIDRLADLARQHALDLDRVAFVGHSAGGHLALWSAGRAALPAASPGADPRVVPVIAIGQGPVVDLRRGAQDLVGNGAVLDFLGGPLDAVPERYDNATPRLSAGPRMVAVVGSKDDVVPPELSVDAAQPDTVEVITIDGADHMILIEPGREPWARVRALLDEALRSRPRAG